MPLSKNIGYIPSNIEFLDKSFETVRCYIDFIELRVSSLAIQNFIGTAVLNINSKNLSDFFNNGGFFNIHLACFSNPHNTTSHETANNEIFRKFSSNFIKDFAQAPLLFKNNCQHIILPVYIDDFSPYNEVFQQLVIDFLNELHGYPDDISRKFLLEYRINKKCQEVQQYLKLIERFKSKLNRQNISLCVDFSHWYQILGRKNFLDFLTHLRKSSTKIQEFHIADYKTSKDDKTLENLPIGSGMIAWSQFLRFFKDSNLALVTNGGVSSVQRSLGHLGNLSIEKKKRIAANFVVTGFYFSRGKNSFFQTSPGTKMAYKYLMEKNLGIKTVLDLGCGNGRNSFFLSRNFNTTTHLIDIDRDLLNYVKELFLIFNANPPIIDVVDLENPDDSVFSKKYDVLLLNYVLQNIKPEYYFDLMNFCREITKEIFIFEIYVNKQVYPEGVVTKRGDNYWYGFSQEEVFKLFETFFDVKAWGIRKGKTNPLMISLIGTPKRNITYDETIFHRYQNVSIVNYSSIRHKLKNNTIRARKKKIKEGKKIEIQNIEEKPKAYDPWENLLSHLLATGITDDQIKLIKTNLLQLNSNFTLKYPDQLGASIFLTARKLKVPIHLQEIVKTIGVSKKGVFREIKKHQLNHDFDWTPPNLEAFFQRYFTLLKLNTIINEEPSEILQTIQQNFNCNSLGSLPHISALAIAVQYLRSSGVNISHHGIAKNLYISPASLKNKIQLLDGIKLNRNIDG